jgi:hypothetical protein
MMTSDECCTSERNRASFCRRACSASSRTFSRTARSCLWDDTVRVVDLTADAQDGRAVVDLLITGPNAQRPTWQLAGEIQNLFGGPVDLSLEYQRNNQSSASVR